MNKQELIDRAIEARRGNICRKENPNAEVVFWDGTSFYFVSRNYANTPAVLESGEVICTTEEFTQRAKELGWINGYKWGVEYPTNGEKHDLPDDVKICITYNNGYSCIQILVRVAMWEDTVKFKIVDERYNPTSKKCLNHIPDTSKMVDNSWHERGELPPVGAECESKLISDGWIGGFVSARSKHYEIWQYLNGDEYVGAHGDREFRPIKSEREKFMTKVESYYPKAANDEQLDALEQLSFALFDAGFRAPK